MGRHASTTWSQRAIDWPLAAWAQLERGLTLALLAVVRAYRLFLSPWLGNACRFQPSCSVYALQALSEHGAARGSWLTVCRLARCQPWCAGGHDPVPTRLFTDLISTAKKNRT